MDGPDAVVRGKMGDCVSENAGQFRFAFQSNDKAGAEVEKASGEGDHFRFARVEQLQGERDVEGHATCDSPGDAADVFERDRVIEALRLSLDFRGQLPAHRDLFFEGVSLGRGGECDSQ